MAKVTFLNISLDCDTDRMSVTSSVDDLTDAENRNFVKGIISDKLAELCQVMTPIQKDALQFTLLSFAASLAASNGRTAYDSKVFNHLLEEKKSQYAIL